jgi:hypothetical protein
MISLLIDFLLQLNSDLLFGSVYEVFNGFLKGDIALFANELKGYILNDRIGPLVIASNVLEDLLKYYCRRDEPKVILKLVKCLDLSKVDVEPIM